MDADFSIELGPEDPVLDFPWTDPAGKLAYVDLKQNLELIAQIDEARQFPELELFLKILNSARSQIETAKCDVWATTELSPEEEMYGASHKFACYVDVVFSDSDRRFSFSAHEQLARKLVELLQRAPEIPAAVELCVRRCFFEGKLSAEEGFYCTLYVSGYGADADCARQNWAVGLNLAGDGMMQSLNSVVR